MKTVSKDMIIADILNVNRGIAAILLQSGMHCLGCPSSQGESLEDACTVHGIDVNTVIDEINGFLATV